MESQLDPFGGLVGHDTPYLPRTEPPDNDENCYYNGGDPIDQPTGWVCDDITSLEDEDAEYGNVPRNDCYIDGVRGDCNKVANNPEMYESDPGSFKLFQNTNNGKYMLGIITPTGYNIPDVTRTNRNEPPTLNGPYPKEYFRNRKKQHEEQLKKRGISIDSKTETYVVGFDIDKIREGIELVWNTPECTQLIQDLLTAVSNKSNPVMENFNPTTLFNKLLAQKKGGLSRSGVNPGAGGSAHGTFRNNDAMVSISPSIWATENGQIISDVGIVINEFLHLAGSKEKYSDKEFAKVVKGNPLWAKSTWQDDSDKTPRFYPDDDPNLTPEGRKLLKTDSMPYSGYFHSVVDNLCLDKVNWSKLSN